MHLNWRQGKHALILLYLNHALMMQRARTIRIVNHDKVRVSRSKTRKLVSVLMINSTLYIWSVQGVALCTYLSDIWVLNKVARDGMIKIRLTIDHGNRLMNDWSAAVVFSDLAHIEGVRSSIVSNIVSITIQRPV